MNPEILIEIARTSLAAGEIVLARRYFKKALGMAPDNMQAGLCLARLEIEQNSFVAAMVILSELWKSHQSVELGNIIVELSITIAKNAEQQKEGDRKVIARLAGMIKALHGTNGIMVDTLEYDIIGGLALDALALIPIYRSGLTERTGKRVIFFSGKSANPALVEMISRELPTFTDYEFPKVLPYTTYDWSTTKFTLNPQYFQDFFGRHADLFTDLVEFTHSTNGRSYCVDMEDLAKITRYKQSTISFSLEEQEKGEHFLRSVMGLPEDGWFVCVYARDAAYYNENYQSPNWFRNSDIRTFLPAIDEILARGGYVVRIGDKACEALHHPNSRFFDYSSSKFREPLLDIFLLAKCRFLLGTPSGLCHVANIFKTPQLMVNSVSVNSVSSCDLYIPKKIIDTRTKQPVSFAEFLRRYYSYDNIGLFAENGLNQENLLAVTYEDNSPEDIALAALEMMDRLQGNHVESPESVCLRESFKESWNRFNPAMADTQIATFFMNKYPELFL